jgi:hypothetical protein
MNDFNLLMQAVSARNAGPVRQDHQTVCEIFK